jgi:hypothetical protein
MKIRIAAPKAFGLRFLPAQHSFPFQLCILKIDEKGQAQAPDDLNTRERALD